MSVALAHRGDFWRHLMVTSSGIDPRRLTRITEGNGNLVVGDTFFRPLEPASRYFEQYGVVVDLVGAKVLANLLLKSTEGGDGLGRYFEAQSVLLPTRVARVRRAITSPSGRYRVLDLAARPRLTPCQPVALSVSRRNAGQFSNLAPWYLPLLQRFVHYGKVFQASSDA